MNGRERRAFDDNARAIAKGISDDVLEQRAIINATKALGLGLAGMTQQRWSAMTSAERDELRDNSGLTPELIGLEGCRVEVVTDYGEKRRFWVGKSTGWRPCHTEIARYNSLGGTGAERHYQSVKLIRRLPDYNPRRMK